MVRLVLTRRIDLPMAAEGHRRPAARSWPRRLRVEGTDLFGGSRPNISVGGGRLAEAGVRDELPSSVFRPVPLRRAS